MLETGHGVAAFLSSTPCQPLGQSALYDLALVPVTFFVPTPSRLLQFKVHNNTQSSSPFSLTSWGLPRFPSLHPESSTETTQRNPTSSTSSPIQLPAFDQTLSWAHCGRTPCLLLSWYLLSHLPIQLSFRPIAVRITISCSLSLSCPHQHSLPLSGPGHLCFPGFLSRFHTLLPCVSC